MKEDVVKMDDVKDEVVDEALSSMDIKLKGENPFYKFLKTASYDKDAKKLVFVTETTDGETTTEVNISDLVGTVADKLIGTEILGLDINGQWYDALKNGGKPIKTPKLFSKR